MVSICTCGLFSIQLQISTNHLVVTVVRLTSLTRNLIVYYYLIHHTGQQCPVTQPTIIPAVHCQVSPPPSQGPPWGVNFTCNDPGGIIFWSGSFTFGVAMISHASSAAPIPVGVSGVSVIESHTTKPSCINSTLTFTGNNLAALNGATIICGNGGTVNDTVTFMLPSKTLMIKVVACYSISTLYLM